MKKSTFILGTVALAVSHTAIAGPFDSCPSKAFLFQGAPASVYGVNLLSGSSNVLASDLGTNSGVNAVGFNFTDRYMYAYATDDLRVVRLGDDFKVQYLNVSGLPANDHFFVGDVYEHHYYLYRKGIGLYKIPLAPLDSDPEAQLTAQRITSNASVQLTDFAINPVDSQMYGVDNKTGILHQFDLTTGEATSVGDTGVTGTFGAGYFDVDGNYYMSRNSDGFIFRINLGADRDPNDVTAEMFAAGPFSTKNDGARCAQAPIIDEDSGFDFGDAPDSYSTTLKSNGPRHEIDDAIWFGVAKPDGDLGTTAADNTVDPDNPDAQLKLADDDVGENDEGGAAIVSAIEPGLDSIINMYANSTGYVVAWVDWNQDGTFSESEQVLSDTTVSAGNNVRVIEVPIDAVAGDTWARFRISNQTGLSFDGGAKSGEVEDQAVVIDDVDTTRRYFPSESSLVTLAYEDNWPLVDDFDLNDVVVRYGVTETLKEGMVAKTKVHGELVAVGADYHNGFAVRIPGVAPENIDLTRTRLIIDGVQQTSANLESGTSDASFIIFDNTKTAVNSECQFFKTQANCNKGSKVPFELHVSFNNPVDTGTIGDMPYDPFIFATENRYHGSIFSELPGRSMEVHLPNKAPTEKFNTSYFQQGDDSSDASAGRYFLTANNLPWAIMVYDEWQWPQERVDLLQAYPDFEQYCESGNKENLDWYMNFTNGKIFVE
ncbi:LruC domain-containing protein [Thaumasiovibrio subtropicus]|uniref:LruC domain-containing protein n=1 Tax=Thaumasiovibrio subtropicus TaxID=1891207 RepID=UPI000B362D31|nr:LruC domain-containing protein [Thaumasiovibrio subtropicus]